MRPVNLIPSEERPGRQRPLRGGPVAYVIVAALALALIGVTVLVITDNQISERKGEVAKLESETAAAEAEANSLASYTQFHSVQEQRVATVAGLADSRFDWVRVMHELALVLPGDVWLTSLTGTVNSSVSLSGGSNISMRSKIPGPALELVGCARSQNAVAGFIQAVKEIDGVTRVGVPASTLGSSSGGSGSSTTSTCQTRKFIAQFQMVIAFDAAPVSETGSGEGEAAAPPPTSTEGAGETATAATSSTSGEGGEGK
jgi:Tfp pilus assembly protein PilN